RPLRESLDLPLQGGRVLARFLLDVLGQPPGFIEQLLAKFALRPRELLVHLRGALLPPSLDLLRKTREFLHRFRALRLLPDDALMQTLDLGTHVRLHRFETATDLLAEIGGFLQQMLLEPRKATVVVPHLRTKE